MRAISETDRRASDAYERVRVCVSVPLSAHEPGSTQLAHRFFFKYEVSKQHCFIKGLVAVKIIDCQLVKLP